MSVGDGDGAKRSLGFREVPEMVECALRPAGWRPTLALGHHDRTGIKVRRLPSQSVSRRSTTRLLRMTIRRLLRWIEATRIWR
jgi:hypothetical protein